MARAKYVRHVRGVIIPQKARPETAYEARQYAVEFLESAHRVLFDGTDDSEGEISDMVGGVVSALVASAQVCATLAVSLQMQEEGLRAKDR